MLLVNCLEAFLALDPNKLTADGSGATLGGVGTTLINIVSKMFSNLALPTVIQEAFSILAQPLALIYGLTGRYWIYPTLEVDLYSITTFSFLVFM